MFNSNRGEDEKTKTMDSTKIALCKRDDDDISSEEGVQEIYMLQLIILKMKPWLGKRVNAAISEFKTTIVEE